MTNIRMIDITAQESETIGKLMDLISDHVNQYELTGSELETLNDADEILCRLYFLFNRP